MHDLGVPVGVLLNGAFIYSKSTAFVCCGKEIVPPTYFTYTSNLKNLSNFELARTKKHSNYETPLRKSDLCYPFPNSSHAKQSHFGGNTQNAKMGRVGI